jgi:hypothetical protein
MKKLNQTREELYHLIWEKPVSRLADELGVKPSELRAYCVKYEIPLPEQGHWSRVQFGKEVKKTPLPPTPVNEPLEEIVNKETEILEPESPIIFPGENELSFKVPDRLIKPDSLIVAAENGLERSPRSEKDMHSTERDQLPIRVSKANIGRALRIMDTLVKCWKKRGYKISIQDGNAFVYLRKVRQRISLREISKKLPKKDPYAHQELKATGQLAFRMDWWAGKEWKDSRLPLEDQILSILNHMEMAARQLERRSAESAAEREKEAVLQHQKTLVIKSDKTDELAFKTLIRDALHWKELKVLAELIVKQDQTPAFLEWLAWAKQKRLLGDPILNFSIDHKT